MQYYLVHSDGWYLSDRDYPDYPYVSPPLKPIDGQWAAFDPDIFVDIKERELIQDPLGHPRWVGPYRKRRYPQYTPNSRWVRHTALYNASRAGAVGARQIILAMHLNFNHLHFPKINLVSSCYERWCVDINHIVPRTLVPSSQFSINYNDPESGRPPVTPLPAWEENRLVTRVPFTAEEAAKERDRIADLLAKTIGYAPPKE